MRNKKKIKQEKRKIKGPNGGGEEKKKAAARGSRASLRTCLALSFISNLVQ